MEPTKPAGTHPCDAARARPREQACGGRRIHALDRTDCTMFAPWRGVALRRVVASSRVSPPFGPHNAHKRALGSTRLSVS